MQTEVPRPPPGKRPRKPLTLTAEERLQLEIWRDAAKPAVRAKRAKVVLACAEMTDVKKIAAACGVSHWTVYEWRRAFLRRRLESFLIFLKRW